MVFYFVVKVRAFCSPRELRLEHIHSIIGWELSSHIQQVLMLNFKNFVEAYLQKKIGVGYLSEQTSQ